MTSAAKFEQWAILDIMGHLKLAGFVTEITIAGTGFIRIDVPETSSAGSYTRMFSPGSLYSISPCTEEAARRVAERLRAVPIEPYELARPAPPRPVPALCQQMPTAAEAYQEFEEAEPGNAEEAEPNDPAIVDRSFHEEW